MYIQVKGSGVEANPNAGLINVFHMNVPISVDCVPQSMGDSPVASIIWSKQGGASDYKQDEYAKIKNTLVFDTLKSINLGTYVCIATKQNGEVAQNEIRFENHGDRGGFFHYIIKVNEF